MIVLLFFISLLIQVQDVDLPTLQVQFNKFFDDYNQYKSRYLLLWGACHSLTQSVDAKKKFKKIFNTEVNTESEWEHYKNRAKRNRNKIEDFTFETVMCASIFITGSAIFALTEIILRTVLNEEYYLYYPALLLTIDGSIRWFAATYSFYNWYLLKKNIKGKPRYRKTEVSITELSDIETASEK